MNNLTDTFIAFKLVIFRAACYFLIPAVTLFLTQTETYSDATWEHMGLFLKLRLALASCIAGSISLCAYIDASMQKASKHADELSVERKETQVNQTIKS